MKASKKRNETLSANAFRAVIEHAHEGIVIYDPSGKIKFASKSLKRVCGYTEPEVIGQSGTRFLHKADVKEARTSFRALVKTRGATITLVQRLRHKKGHYIWAESTLTNFLHLPEVNGVVSNFRDITDRKIAEERASESQELLKLINQNITEAICHGIIGKKFIYVNNSFLELFGYKSLHDLQKINPVNIFASIKERNAIVAALRKNPVLKNKRMYFRRKNGTTFLGAANISVLPDRDKQVSYVCTIRDITLEKESEVALLDSRSFLQNIISTVAAPVFVKDHKHRWVLFNQKFGKLIGQPESAMLGKTDRDFLSRAEADVFWKIDDEVLRTGKTIRNLETFTGKDGVSRSLLTIKSRFVNERKEKFVTGFIADITELKNAESKINNLNANLKAILESTDEFIYAVDTNYRYISFNQHYKKMMHVLYKVDIEEGKSKLGFLKKSRDHSWVKLELDKALGGHHFVSEHKIQFGSRVRHIRSTFNPIRNAEQEIIGVAVFMIDITERKKFEEIIKSANATLRGIIESTTDHVVAIDKKLRYITFNKAHASTFNKLLPDNIRFGDSFVMSFPLPFRNRIRQLMHKALQGEPLLVEEQLLRDTYFEVALNPIKNDLGTVTGVAFFARDITQRKIIEEKMIGLNEELTAQNVQLAAQEEELKATLEELSDRNFELDQIMYKTSHDLRSPLSSIMGLVNLANLDLEPSNHKLYLDKIEGRIKKLDEFISSMLNYARVNRTDTTREKIDLRTVANNCLKELEYLENFKSVKTTIDVTARSSEIITDALCMNIIFGNIISNAYKYYNPEVKSFLKITIQLTPKVATIEFEDNGIGIREEHHKKIFNMFYRATERSQGSGLGMYIVKQAVEKLHGDIAISSVYGTGTKISIRFPMQEY